MILNDEQIIITIGSTIFTSYQRTKPMMVLDQNAISGWMDGVTVKRTEAPRPNEWGDFNEATLLGPRNITITGTAVANTRQELQTMRDSFASLLINGVPVYMKVQTTSYTRYATVMLAGSPSWVQQLDTSAIWKLDLYAPDPRIYGIQNTVQISSSVAVGMFSYPISYALNYSDKIVTPATTVANYGNTDSWPVFKVTGDYPSGFSITDNRNSKVTYTGMVSLQSPVYIDMGAGTAKQHGIDKTSQMSRRDWFSIAPNESIQPLFLPTQSTTGWCDIIYRDTWI